MSKEMKAILLKMFSMVLLFIIGMLGLDMVNSKLKQDVQAYREEYGTRLDINP